MAINWGQGQQLQPLPVPDPVGQAVSAFHAARAQRMAAEHAQREQQRLDLAQAHQQRMEERQARMDERTAAEKLQQRRTAYNQAMTNVRGPAAQALVHSEFPEFAPGGQAPPGQPQQAPLAMAGPMGAAMPHPQPQQPMPQHLQDPGQVGAGSQNMGQVVPTGTPFDPADAMSVPPPFQPQIGLAATAYPGQMAGERPPIEATAPTPMAAAQGSRGGADEQGFQQWYKQTAQMLGINPNPDDPNHHYDYRAFYQAMTGGKYQPPMKPGDHFPSEFKTEGHPREFLYDQRGRFNTKTMIYDDGSPVQGSGEGATEQPPVMTGRDGIPNLAQSAGRMAGPMGAAQGHPGIPADDQFAAARREQFDEAARAVQALVRTPQQIHEMRNMGDVDNAAVETEVSRYAKDTIIPGLQSGAVASKEAPKMLMDERKRLTDEAQKAAHDRALIKAGAAGAGNKDVLHQEAQERIAQGNFQHFMQIHKVKELQETIGEGATTWKNLTDPKASPGKAEASAVGMLAKADQGGVGIVTDRDIVRVLKGFYGDLGTTLDSYLEQMTSGHLPPGVHEKIAAWTKMQIARSAARLDHVHESAYRSYGKQPSWSQWEGDFDIQADRGELGLPAYSTPAAPTDPVKLTPGGSTPPVRPPKPKPKFTEL